MSTANVTNRMAGASAAREISPFLLRLPRPAKPAETDKSHAAPILILAGFKNLKI